MSDYSIELSVERIDNPQTKEYFREVLSSYQAENFRSAIVMLWSVIICDLIYKLQHLRDVDSDSIAQEILADIEAKQKANPNSPDWEIHLLKSIKDKTELLDTADFTNLNSMQQIRHLSAHPVLSNTDLLFTPYKEQARSFIRIALESVLTKPPVFLKKVVDEFVVDIASKKDILPDDTSLKRYLESKYFRRLRPTTENHLFRALWKFVFRLENDDTNENRNINYRCLKIIFIRRINEIKGLIREHKDFFSNLGNEISLNYLLDFLADYPDVYELLDDSARILIEQHSNSDLKNFAVSFYLSDSVESHFDKILEKVETLKSTYSDSGNYITEKSWEKLLTIGHEHNLNTIVKKIAIQIYTKSASFNSADKFFNVFIEPIMSQFDADEVIEFIEKTETNSQAYARGKAIIDHKQFIEVCGSKLPLGFDETKNPMFFRYKKYFVQEATEAKF